jgi:hypothetical protein
MAASKTFFEQIPIETVKRIAKEFPEENAVGSDGGNTEMLGEVKSHRDGWRELAQKVQHERDPNRVTELVEQLIATLDQEQLSKGLPRKRDAGNHSD